MKNAVANKTVIRNRPNLRFAVAQKQENINHIFFRHSDCHHDDLLSSLGVLIAALFTSAAARSRRKLSFS